MKKLQLIVDEVKAKLPKNTDEYTNNKNWKLYKCFTGYINDDYFSLYFRETIKGSTCIEIAHTTTNPDYFIKLIKDIEPKAVINYSEVVTTTISHTV
jgi:hypothetical protein